jgi:DNA primase
VSIGADDIQRVKQATDVLSLVGEYTQLKRVGRSYMGLCPFHQERTPSFSIDPEQGLFYCFGCRKGGDIIRFLQEIEGMSFTEAVSALAGRAGIEISETDRGPSEGGRRRKLLEAMERLVSFYEAQLETAEGSAAGAYLKERGLAPETIKRFRLGYAPWKRHDLSEATGIDRSLLEVLGVVMEKEGTLVPILGGRVIFPIMDAGGRPIALAGRILPPEFLPARVDPTRVPKYRNTKESPLYRKRQTLYALHLAKGTAVTKHEMVVCEGYFDAIAFHQAGIPNTVATCGTALTDDHLRTISRFCERIVLAFDADKAGLMAVFSAQDRAVQFSGGPIPPAGQPNDLVDTVGTASSYSLSTYVANLQGGKDPGDLMQAPEALRRAVEEKKDLVAFLVESIASEVPSGAPPAARMEAARRAVAVVARLPEPIRRPYLDQVSLAFGMDRASVERQCSMALSRRGSYRAWSSSSPEREPAQPDPVTLAALGVVVQYPEVAAGYVHSELFPEGTARELVSALERTETPSQAYDVLSRQSPEAASLLTRLLNERVPGDPKDILAKYLLQLAKRTLQAMRQTGGPRREQQAYLLRRLKNAQARYGERKFDEALSDLADLLKEMGLAESRDGSQA